MRRLGAKVLGLLAVLGFMGGCGDEVAPTPQSWTVLVYMVADNNLEPFGVSDLEEMAAVGEMSGVRIVAQVDRQLQYSADAVPGLGTWTGTKRIELGASGFDEVSTLGATNMGAPGTLADFVSWGIKRYPADHYALVFWDHGGAWPGFGGDESFGGDTLSLAEMKQGLQQGLSATSVKSFSLIGFDACLMATYEVARTLQPYGDYLLASEELEPGNGWDYRKLGLLKTDPTQGPIPVGKALVDGFKAQSGSYNQGSNITLSLVDLKALDGVAAALDALSAAGAGSMGTAANGVARARQDSLEFGAFANPAQSLNMVDLGDLSARLAPVHASYGPAVTQLQTAMAKAVLYKTNGPVTQASTGLSIYFPANLAYYQTPYNDVEVAASWRGFLKAFYDQAASTGLDAPRFTNADHLAAVAWSGGSYILEGTLATGAISKIASATLTYGIRDSTSGNLLFLGDQPAYVDSGTQKVRGSWDLTVLTLTQGSNVGYGYMSLQVTETNALAVIIPFEYQEPGRAPQIALRTLVFDRAGTLLQDTYYAVANGNYGELAGVSGARLRSLIQVQDTAGNVTWEYGSNDFSASDLSAQPIALSFSTIASGRTAFGIVDIANFAGNGDYVYNIGSVP